MSMKLTGAVSLGCTLLAAVVVLGACKGTGDGGADGLVPDAPADTEGAGPVDATDADPGAEPSGSEGCCDVPVSDWMQWRVHPSPLRVEFHSPDGGAFLTALGGHGKTGAFYLYDTETGTRTDLAGPATQKDEPDRTTMTTPTTDGRTATLVIETAQEASIRVTFTVDPQKATERLAADFEVAEDEAFYGVMERVVQGGQDQSWDPATTEGLNLRGQAFELWMTPT